MHDQFCHDLDCRNLQLFSHKYKYAFINVKLKTVKVAISPPKTTLSSSFCNLL